MTIARILLVEDDPVSRELITALLASRGHMVDAVDDGFGALRLAQERSYDLVFVDYHLPEMDGYALARLMRLLSDTARGDLKMIAITADRFGLAARRSIDSLFDRVLTKPIEPDDLFAFLDEFLGQESRRGDLGELLAAAAALSADGAGHMSWHAQGLGALPSAAAFPPPTRAERASLKHCFRVVEAEEADCLLLLRRAGLAGLEAVRACGKAYLQPLFIVDPDLSQIADVRLNLVSRESWSVATSTIKTFAARVKSVKAEIVASRDFDTRVAAYLFVADRALRLCRDPSGRIDVPYTAGFSASALIETVKRLAARGLVYAKLDPNLVEHHLLVSLTPKGLDFVSDDASRLRNAG